MRQNKKYVNKDLFYKNMFVPVIFNNLHIKRTK